MSTTSSTRWKPRTGELKRGSPAGHLSSSGDIFTGIRANPEANPWTHKYSNNSPKFRLIRCLGRHVLWQLTRAVGNDPKLSSLRSLLYTASVVVQVKRLTCDSTFFAIITSASTNLQRLCDQFFPWAQSRQRNQPFGNGLPVPRASSVGRRVRVVGAFPKRRESF